MSGFLRKLWWLIAEKRKPVSAYIAIVAYMFVMGIAGQVEIWFWTALPLYWAWVAVVWRLQANFAGPEKLGPS